MSYCSIHPKRQRVLSYCSTRLTEIPGLQPGPHHTIFHSPTSFACSSSFFFHLPHSINAKRPSSFFTLPAAIQTFQSYLIPKFLPTARFNLIAPCRPLRLPSWNQMTPIGNHSISISIEPSGPHELVMAAVCPSRLSQLSSTRLAFDLRSLPSSSTKFGRTMRFGMASTKTRC